MVETTKETNKTRTADALLLGRLSSLTVGIDGALSIFRAPCFFWVEKTRFILIDLFIIIFYVIVVYFLFFWCFSFVGFVVAVFCLFVCSFACHLKCFFLSCFL
jgi:hypothetical protein